MDAFRTCVAILFPSHEYIICITHDNLTLFTPNISSLPRPFCSEAGYSSRCRGWWRKRMSPRRGRDRGGRLLSRWWVWTCRWYQLYIHPYTGSRSKPGKCENANDTCWKLRRHDANFAVTGAISNDKVGIMATLGFQCISYGNNFIILQNYVTAPFRCCNDILVHMSTARRGVP